MAGRNAARQTTSKTDTARVGQGGEDHVLAAWQLRGRLDSDRQSDSERLYDGCQKGDTRGLNGWVRESEGQRGPRGLRVSRCLVGALRNARGRRRGVRIITMQETKYKMVAEQSTLLQIVCGIGRRCGSGAERRGLSRNDGRGQ